jgi:vacuolar-type H+-ATPase subunit H
MAIKTIDVLLANLEETLEEGVGVPLSGGKRMVDIDAARDIIDEIRENLPQEIASARSIVNDRNKIIQDARHDADSIIQAAETRARAMLNRNEIVTKAQDKARDITREANRQAATLRATVTKYCDNMLQNTQEQLQKSYGEIKVIRDSLKK